MGRPLQVARKNCPLPLANGPSDRCGWRGRRGPAAGDLLAQKIRIPPHEIAGGGHRAGDRIPVRGVEELLQALVGPDLHPGIGRVDVTNHELIDGVVLIGFTGAEEEIAAPGVAHVEAELGVRLLDHVGDFEAGARRIDVGEVEAVAMAQAAGPKGPAVVVDRERAVDDLVTPVAVDVADADAVLSLALVGEGRALIGPAPDLLQLPILQRPRVDLHPAIRAARGEDGRGFPIEVGDGHEMPARTVARVVAPVLHGSELNPGRLVNQLAILAIVHRNEFRAVERIARAGARRGGLERGGVGRAAHNDLGLVVPVEVAHDHGRPPNPHIHVPTKIDRP